MGALSQRSWAASESRAWAQEMMVVRDKGIDTLLGLWGANRDLQLVERGTEICSQGTQPGQLTVVQEVRDAGQHLSSGRSLCGWSPEAGGIKSYEGSCR